MSAPQQPDGREPFTLDELYSFFADLGALLTVLGLVGMALDVRVFSG